MSVMVSKNKLFDGVGGWGEFYPIFVVLIFGIF